MRKAEMTLVMTSLPLARVFQRLFTFALIGGNLTVRSTGSHRGIGGGIQIPERERRSWMLSFLFLPRRHRAPESLLPGLVIILQQASPSFSDMGVPPRGSEQFMDGWSETGTKKIHKKCFIYSKLIIVSSRYKLTGLCKGICNGKHSTVNIAKWTIFRL